MKKAIFGLVALFLGSSLLAQKNDFGNWFIYFGNQPINQKWNWWTEAQFRNYDVGDVQQVLLRTGIGVNLTENNDNLLLGYGFIYSENYKPDFSKTNNIEHRIYQQYIHKHQLGKLSIQHRLRWEERFLESGFQMRGRYFLGLNFPLSRNAFAPKTFYLSMYDEIFLNAQNELYDRNRIYGALGFVVSKNLRLEAGIMNQSTKNISRNQLQLVINQTLPF